MPIPTMFSLLLELTIRADRLHQDAIRGPQTQEPVGRPAAVVPPAPVGHDHDSDVEDSFDSLDAWPPEPTEEITPSTPRVRVRL